MIIHNFSAIPSRLLGVSSVIDKSLDDTSRMKRYEMRKRNASTEEVSNETSPTLAEPAQVNSTPPQDNKIESPPPKRVRVQDDDIDTEEDLQKILNIVLERVHCLEQELEGLTHIMGDIKGRIERIQSRY